jgi:hypothetical protein
MNGFQLPFDIQPGQALFYALTLVALAYLALAIRGAWKVLRGK